MKSRNMKPFIGAVLGAVCLIGSGVFVQAECYHPNAYQGSIQYPTCTTDGFYQVYCPDCGYSTFYTSASYGHSFTEYITLIEPTCAEGGYATRYCTECGYVESIDLPTDDSRHYYEGYEEVVSPTCISEGYEKATCLLCGQEIFNNYVYPSGHSYADYEIIQEATCKEEGLRRGYCIYCQEPIEETIPISGHNFDEGEILKKATCKAEGTIKYTCLTCGTTEEQELEKADHTFKTWEVKLKPTDFSFGKKSAKCTVCGIVKSRKTKLKGTIVPGDHDTLDVYVLQELLMLYDYLGEDGSDGSYGDITKKAIIKFQKDNKYEETGIAFPQTINKLMKKYYAQLNEEGKEKAKLGDDITVTIKYDEDSEEEITTLQFKKEKEKYSWTLK